MNHELGSVADGIGVIQAVDLREVWVKEAYDFTPWLAKNINLLSQTLGLDLELRAEEAAVGNFSLDLLAHDLGSDRVVIIENQLSVTDHDHLGKLLTYAAGYDAGVAVWIASSFREEHRQALDWMNQRTDTSTEFFGIVVEAWRIDCSRPACNLKIVSAPNSWQKSVGKKSAASSSRGERYQQFFQRLLDELRGIGFTKAKAAQPQNWYSFSSGMTGITYGTTFSMDSRVRAEVYIGRGDRDINKAIFDHLLGSRAEIEHEFGALLEWERLNDRTASRIAIYRSGSIDDENLDLEELVEWNISYLQTLRTVFGPRIQTLMLNQDLLNMPPTDDGIG